jgi:hypothetical protein
MSLQSTTRSNARLRLSAAGFALPAALVLAGCAHSAPPPAVFDFTHASGLSPWQTWMPAKADDGVELTLPGRTDQNHLDGVGPIYLLAHLPMRSLLASGSPCDLRWAELVISVRTSGVDLAGGRICWLIVSEIPVESRDADYPWQQTNWACVGRPVVLSPDSGERSQVVSTVLTPDPSLWRYAGTADMSPWSGRYVWFPLARSLANANATLHLCIVGCDPGRTPSGRITLRSAEIRFASPPKCPTDEDIEAVLASGDWTAARPLLEIAAAHGMSGAAFHLGNALKFGLGGPVDYRRALGYFESAAKEEPEAAVEQADLLAKGLGAEQDYPMAVRLLTADPVARIPRAKYLLGMMRWRGKGTAVDLHGARRLLEEAAAGGQDEAVVPAGFVSMELGDLEQAYRWLKLSKERFAETLGPMVDIVERRIAVLSGEIPEVRRRALDSEVAAWPSRPFSAARDPG